MTTTTADIVQVDAVLCEDGRCVMLMGHVDGEDAAFVATFPLPVPITEDEFLHAEWAALQNVPWRRT
ncbi:hypothetical protein ACUN0C_15195 [Faunimonas sp. B44]|uniref:hypothetical protein n=1 Tax=Faunimonas sp. B44 TaxID=3461493 RepID=UPI0040445DC4